MKRVASTKSPRNTVPAFVQKAYKIVSDTNNHDIIRWSESGESFLILDHQRLARQVLGRWFKHENFNSFIRQLNNYGFHKIPDLKQGALRNESEIEHYCFSHVDGHFRRGKPGLLHLIRSGTQASRTRNRNPVHTWARDGDDNDTTMDLINAGDPHAFSSPEGATDLPVARRQNSDVPTISQGIAAIKREQTKQTAELDRLKHAYQLLLQEHMDCRTKLREHQETIGHILDFLARVFETHHAKNNKDDTGNSDGATDAVILRRTVGPTVQGAPGARGDGSFGSFEVTEVEASVSEGKNNISTYSIETPVEDAGSPATSVSTLDDGHLGIVTANYHDPRTLTGAVYNIHSCPGSQFNPPVTPNRSAYYATLLSQNLNDPGFGERQTGVLTSVLDFPTPQTPSPLRMSQSTPPNITEGGTGNPGAPQGPVLLDIDTAPDSSPIQIPVHNPPRLEKHLPATEGIGHEANTTGYQINDLADLFCPYSPETTEKANVEDGLGEGDVPLLTTAFPPTGLPVMTPTTPQATTTPHPASATSSPTFGDTPSLSVNAISSPLDTPFHDTPSFVGSDFVLDPLLYHTGIGMGDYGCENWMDEVDIDTMNGVDEIGTGRGTKNGDRLVGATPSPANNGGPLQNVTPSLGGGSLSPARAMTTIKVTNVPIATVNISTAVDSNVTVAATTTVGRKRKSDAVMNFRGSEAPIVVAVPVGSKKRRV